MTTRTASSAPRHVTPWFVPILNIPAALLLKAGVPLGLNGLITIRGRTSGEPRTTPVAIIHVDGRRWIWCPWGEAHWVRNLRAAGEATITVRKREERIRATELDHEASVAFFREVAGFEQLRPEDFDPVLSLEPEVVLLGTGLNHRVAHPRLTAWLARAGAALEAMDTKAACRTYNILAADGRRVAGAFLQEPAQP